MAKLEQYREYIQKIIAEYGSHKTSYSDIDVETIFDTERDLSIAV